MIVTLPQCRRGIPSNLYSQASPAINLSSTQILFGKVSDLPQPYPERGATFTMPPQHNRDVLEERMTRPVSEASTFEDKGRPDFKLGHYQNFGVCSAVLRQKIGVF
jgi:hypothetical protein